jgi:hypothetical protein
MQLARVSSGPRFRTGTLTAAADMGTFDGTRGLSRVKVVIFTTLAGLRGTFGTFPKLAGRRFSSDPPHPLLRVPLGCPPRLSRVVGRALPAGRA